MEPAIEFETPENVRIKFEPAGLGTRFLGWVTDELLLVIIIFVLFIAALFLGALSGGWSDSLDKILRSPEEVRADPSHPFNAPFYVFGIVLLAIGLINFLYFGLFELLMHGQTPGKRSVKIRVVKASGFALDPASVAIRNIFRVIDHIPVCWIVPLLSKRQQRFGDLAAGTLIVSERKSEIHAFREIVLSRDPSTRLYRFEGRLARLSPEDIRAVERVLDRAYRVGVLKCADPLRVLAEALARKLQMEPPEADKCDRFLEELIAAEYRRQDRQFG